MHNFVTEICTCVHIPVTKWCIVENSSNALWDLWGGSFVEYAKRVPQEMFSKDTKSVTRVGSNKYLVITKNKAHKNKAQRFNAKWIQPS